MGFLRVWLNGDVGYVYYRFFEQIDFNMVVVEFYWEFEREGEILVLGFNGR